ncbi:MAG TPA: hypothetical protein VFS48_04980 [Solirubrobacterales bacterium]|nr:hypothetical protein [Solirubrobacterales bacterium]
MTTLKLKLAGLKSVPPGPIARLPVGDVDRAFVHHDATEAGALVEVHRLVLVMTPPGRPAPAYRDSLDGQDGSIAMAMR